LPTLCRFTARQLLGEDAAFKEVRQSLAPIMIDLPYRFSPATRRLREILHDSLGGPRLVLCDATNSARAADPSAMLYSGASGLDLLDWCGLLLGGTPAGIVATSAPGGNFATIVLAWSDGRAAEIRHFCRNAPHSEVHLRVIAERGVADLQLPRSVRWSDGVVEHVENVEAPGAAQAVLESFHRAVVRGESPRPAIEDLDRALELLGYASKSQEEGRARRVEEGER
jgi:predicted dehydrogenase